MARFLTKSDTNSFTAANMVILINNAMERIVGKLITASAGGKWHFGDSNYTATPTGLKTLVNSQEAYQLMGNLVATTGTGIDTTTPLLNFLGASVKDKNGIWHVLQPIHLSEIFNQDIDPAEYFKTDGLPAYYELREDFLILYPAPDNGVSVTLSNGLKVFFQRSAQLITSSTATTYPGFPSPWHDIIAYDAAYNYAIANGLSNAPQLQTELLLKEKSLMEFMSQRSQDEQERIITRPISFR